MTGQITTAVAKGALQINPGHKASYSLSVASTKHYSGKAVLERSVDFGGSWVVQATFDGTGASLDDTTADAGTIENESRDRQLFRFRGVTATANEGLDFVLTQVQASTPATRLTHAAMVEWLNALPTADPAVIGEPYLSSGALKVSAG